MRTNTASTAGTFTRELDRQLAIELFRRLRWGGLVPLFFVPALALGCGYTSRLSLWILAVNFALVLLRGWLALRAYAESNDPDPEAAIRWRRLIRAVSIAQSANWWVLSTLMMLDFGRTENGYFVLAASVGWTMAAPAFFAPDLFLGRIISFFNPMPLLIWNLVGTSNETGLVLVLGLLGLALLSAKIQHGYVREMYSARIAFEQAQRDLRAAKDVAEEAAAAKGQFLANMSHEIRTPLNGIIGLADILNQCELDGAAKDVAADLRRSGQHLLSIVNDVLDLSKIGAGKMTLERVPMALRELVKACAADFQAMARTKNLTLAYDVVGEVPETVMGDPLRIRQVLGNLIGNAVKFTQSGSVTVGVSCEGEDSLCLTVRDTGIGIPGDRLDAIFEEFSQAESSTTRRFGGTGLGLSISRQLAGLMGGSIVVESILGQGSSFHFRIPLAVDPSAQAHEAVPLWEWTLAPDFRILVVDDNPVNLRICLHLTRKTGAIVESASNGLAAIAMHSERPYDLILMDCHMPELDGWQTTAKIREMGGPMGLVPVYALTANVFSEVREKCKAAGMNGYLTKPIQLKELHDALRAHAPAAEPPART